MMAGLTARDSRVGHTERSATRGREAIAEAHGLRVSPSATGLHVGYHRPVVSRRAYAAADGAACSGRSLRPFLTCSNRQGSPARVNQRRRFKSAVIARSDQPPARNVSIVVNTRCSCASGSRVPAICGEGRDANDTLHRLATRIQARPSRRCGELLKTFENHGARTDQLPAGTVPKV